MTILTLLVGMLGAIIALLLNLPLAMLLGPLIATLVAAMSGMAAAVPQPLRVSVQIALGAFLASKFNPEVAQNMSLWPISLGVVPLFVVSATLTSMWYFISIAKLDRMTAAFASVPGGLLLMAAIGGELGGDERRITVSQALRVLLTVLFVAALIWHWQGFQRDQTDILFQNLSPNIGQLLLVVAVSIVATLGAGKLHLPIPYFFGPMIVLAPLYLMGLLSVQIPGPFLAIALWVMGSSIGSRFQGFTYRELATVLGHSFVSVLLLLAVSLLFAKLLSTLLDIPFVVVFLAFAPGGVAEMSMVALALDINPAFVTVHHLLRICFCMIAIPFLAKWFTGHKSP